MGLEIDADFSQQFLLPPSLEDFVGPEHPARFIRDFVSTLDLAALGFPVRTAAEGRPSYAPALLLRVWLYGYLMNVRSSRRTEAFCKSDLGALWLCGMHAPDHNSLWRFWKKSRPALRALFTELVRRSVKQGHVGFALHALDGTKILAASSPAAALHSKDLEKAMGRLDERIARLEKEIEGAEPQEQALASALGAAREKREELAGKHAALAQKNMDHEQPQEPDARMMKDGARVRWAWNAQALADAKSGLIVAADACASAADFTLLAPMLEQGCANTGRPADATVADGGYAKSEEQIGRAEQMGHNVTTPRPHKEQAPFASARFSYDEKTGCASCPIGQRLSSDGGHTRHRSRMKEPVRRFYCPVHQKCPRRSECCQGIGPRSLEVGMHRPAVDRARQRAASAQGQALIAKRQGIIERVFAHIKHNCGLRRFLSRGQENIRAEWTMACLAYNLQILARKRPQAA